MTFPAASSGLRGARTHAGLSTGTGPLAGALLTFALAWATCQALHASSEWSALAPCLAAFGYLAWRPTWRDGRRSAATR